MSKRKSTARFRVSRRTVLIAGGGVAAVAVGAAMTLRSQARDISFLKEVDLSGAKPLGDGFYEVDGWVLTADDIKRLGGATPADDSL